MFKIKKFERQFGAFRGFPFLRSGKNNIGWIWIFLSQYFKIRISKCIFKLSFLIGKTLKLN